MSKQVKITPELQVAIRNGVGDPDFSTDNVTVFEARMLSTEAVRQGGFFNGARVSPSTLQEMANFLNQPGKAIHLHIMHETRLLPVGRVFSAKTFTTMTGETELRGQFYLPNDEAALISKIENSVLDEVSVGLKTKHAFCSECNFDFLGEEADIMNFLTATCGEGHVIGENGVHARLVGLDQFIELSLVGQGAAKDAKILPRARQSMSKETMERLAAQGKPFGVGIFTGHCKMDNSETKGEDVMSAEFEALMGKFTAQTSELAEKNAELKAALAKVAELEGEVTSLKASVTDKDKEIQTLNEAASKDENEVATELAASKKELEDATEKLAPHVKAALVASGVAEKDIPATLSAQADLIVEKGLKLHQIVSPTAVSEGTKTDDQIALEAAKADEERRKGSFKLSNKEKN